MTKVIQRKNNNNDKNLNSEITIQRYHVRGETWIVKFQQKGSVFYESMVIHDITLDKMVHLDVIIKEELIRRIRMGHDYQSTIEQIKRKTIDMNENQLQAHLMNVRPKSTVSSLMKVNDLVIMDLFLIYDYLKTLPEYYEGFFLRYELKSLFD